MIDIEKFICSLLANHPVGVTIREDIHKALKDQGLEYKDGKIAPIEGKRSLPNSEDEGIKGAIIEHLRDNNLTEWASWLEKQGEQKSTNKIEPKFHEGEWITNGDYTWQIVMVKSLDYILQSQGGNIVEDTISHVDEHFHSFTIQDAKDGDVLATPNYIYIFNSIDKETETVAFYCLMEKSDEHFSFGDYRIFDEILNSVPATKEQRDLLFQKMKEAGYEWDAEKKELKKIEQKPTWNGEDESIYQSIIDDTVQENQLDDKQINWLKSLKDRYTWKPSEEQINALDSTLQYSQVSHNSFEHLNSLYNDLKKLK